MAMKYSDGCVPEVDDINLKNLEITPEELQNRLDVSSSTANNWYTNRNPISKMGKLAIKHEIQKEMDNISKKIKKKNNILIENDRYKVLFKSINGNLDLIAETNQEKVARTLEYLNIIYGFVQNYYELLLEHEEEKDCKTELLNILDMMCYIKTGTFYSQEYEKRNGNIEINTSFDEICNSKRLEEIRNKIFQNL